MSVKSTRDYSYHIAFDATAETKNPVFAEQPAAGECDFSSKHSSEEETHA